LSRKQHKTPSPEFGHTQVEPFIDLNNISTVQPTTM
jgi:hypothetical protein